MYLGRSDDLREVVNRRMGDSCEGSAGMGDVGGVWGMAMEGKGGIWEASYS